jgi:hypothetical protein
LNVALTRAPFPRVLLVLFAAYAVASLIHFAHNATFLADYPHLPRTWTPAGVMLAWIAVSAIGAFAVHLLLRGHTKTGLCVAMIYAACGLDSLGYYVLAPLALHTHAMNATILIEVACAALLFAAALLELARRVFGNSRIARPHTPR